jgi:hypothetical protein
VEAQLAHQVHCQLGVTGKKVLEISLGRPGGSIAGWVPADEGKSLLSYRVIIMWKVEYFIKLSESALLNKKIKIYYLLASSKTLIIVMNIPKAASNFCSGFPSIMLVVYLVYNTVHSLPVVLQIRCYFDPWIRDGKNSDLGSGSIFWVTNTLNSLLRIRIREPVPF